MIDKNIKLTWSY